MSLHRLVLVSILIMSRFRHRQHRIHLIISSAAHQFHSWGCHSQGLTQSLRGPLNSPSHSLPTDLKCLPEYLPCCFMMSVHTALEVQREERRDALLMWSKHRHRFPQSWRRRMRSNIWGRTGTVSICPSNSQPSFVIWKYGALPTTSVWKFPSRSVYSICISAPTPIS
jgi:hypothetical protein